MLGPKLEVPFNFLESVPELRAPTLSLSVKNIPISKVFGTEEIRPETPLILVKFPNPLN
jgi:hypothetical protein